MTEHPNSNKIITCRKPQTFWSIGVVEVQKYQKSINKGGSGHWVKIVIKDADNYFLQKKYKS